MVEVTLPLIMYQVQIESLLLSQGILFFDKFIWRHIAERAVRPLGIVEEGDCIPLAPTLHSSLSSERGILRENFIKLWIVKLRTTENKKQGGQT
jgi:hypothetical protein